VSGAREAHTASGSLPDAERLATLLLLEDGPVDVTTEVTVAPATEGRAVIEFREPGVVAGLAYAEAVARRSGAPLVVWRCGEGQGLDAGTVVGTLHGPLAPMLRAERPLLNLLQRASGIATITRRFVDAVVGTPCRILHTRKTGPGLREFDVRAVLAGGGSRHRTDLAREVMVKDNHWRALARQGRTLLQALENARARGVTACHVEVESPVQLEEACAAGATRVLIDNQAPETVRVWAERARALDPRVQVEASGGISLDNVRCYAEAGADFVSVGALTHSVRAADIALTIQ